MRILLFLTAFVLVLANLVSLEGFVKPTDELKATLLEIGTRIDYSSVSIQLLTKEGFVKDSTKCNPTGYFVLPVYDNGLYYLTVSGPEAPEKHKVTLTNGQKEPQEDFNFAFHGYTLTGSIFAKNMLGATVAGPSGVVMTLHKELSPNVAYKTITTESQGKFKFSQLVPGNYVIKASHPSWILDAPTQKVTFTTSTNIVTQIFVLGYKISGEVSSNGHPMSGVSIFLYSQDQFVPKSTYSCATVSAGPVAGKTPICEASSNANGLFEFSGIPAGNYRLVPYYRGFKIAPEESLLAIDGSNTHLPEFVVKGFVIHGTVVDTLKNGIANVIILINGKETSTTNEKGDYTLDGISSGRYTIEAQKEHMMFTKLEDVEILPNTPRIPPISISHLDICGQVHVKDFSLTREVSLKPDNAPEQITSTNKQGKFCFKAAVTTKVYTVKAIITPSEVSKGLAIKPDFHQISLENEPVLGLKFEQSLFSINGKVSCKKSPCEPIKLTLESNDGKIDKMVTESFEFNNLLAGNYKVSVAHKNWCFEKSTFDILLEKTQTVEIKVVQKGFDLFVDSPQDVLLRVKQDGSEVSIKKGNNKYCLEKSPGIYHLVPSSCFIFDQSEYVYDSTNPEKLVLVVTGSQIQGVIKTRSEAKDGIQVMIDDKETIQAKYVGNLIYEYTLVAKSNDPIKVRPVSKSHIFVPAEQTIQMTSSKCVSALDFVAREGIFISGIVKPNIENAEIQIKKSGIIVQTAHSDVKGAWTVGPLYDDEEYVIDCVKEGYQVLRQSKTEFYLSKYSSVVIKVVDQESQPISGVFLSLSGEGFRNNAVTENGIKTFSELWGGNFYLKSMLKEYMFEPETVSFDLKDGETKTIEIKAKRTSYSVFGRVTSLNGNPIVGVIVSAIGKNNEYEEAFTDSNGNYRIRGLDTKEYTVSIKKGDLIERAYPSQYTFKMEAKDALDYNFMAFKAIKNVLISGFVSTSLENAKNIEIELLVGMDVARAKVLRKLPLAVNNFFMFSNLPKENVNYFVRVKSNFDGKFYDDVSPVIQAIPNANSFIEFAPKLKEKDYGQENFYGIVLALLVFVIGLYWRDLSKFFIK